LLVVANVLPGGAAVVVLVEGAAGFDELLHATARTGRNTMRPSRRTGEDCTSAIAG